jgi:hypothetical protein
LLFAAAFRGVLFVLIFEPINLRNLCTVCSVGPHRLQCRGHIILLLSLFFPFLVLRGVLNGIWWNCIW